jgi:glycosyltransferase involved in cell wall biosynthesis
MWASLQRRALCAATCFHATAASEADEIRALGFRQPIAVIPHGIDAPADPSSCAERRREVLFLGRLCPKKGIDPLLRAWSRVQVQFPKWHLRIVGPDERGYLASMKALAASLVVERVTFEGELVGQARDDAYERASVFVLPTLNENFGVAVAEALAHATPVIVTKGAPWSGLERHRCGWWIDFGDDALAAALAQAMSCPAGTLAEMGDRGRRWVQAEFTWDEVGAQMEQVYQWLLAGAAAAERPAFVQASGS